ncbi:MAG: hypothetical protein ACK4SX_01755 [Alcanivoracaceae bacterium]
MRHLARSLLLSVLLFCTPLLAMPQNDLLRLAVEYNMLGAELNLMFFEPESREYAEAAARRYGSVSTMMPVWLASLPGDQADRAGQAWKELRDTLEGRGGLLQGYDATLNARYTIANDELREQLMSQPLLDSKALAQEQYAWLLTARVISAYMAVAAAPFGSFALSATDDDSRLSVTVMELDQVWTGMVAAAPESQRAQLVRTQRRWQFIRETILRATQQSLPFIVRHHGDAILRELGDLAGS